MVEKVSVIVIAHNEAGYIWQCVGSVLSQVYENFELIIIDSYSNDHTLDIIKKAAVLNRIIKYYSIPEKGYSVARNFGLGQADTNYIFFIDADCVADKHWLEYGIRELNKEGVAGVSGLTYYVSEKYKPSVRDYVVYNKNGRVYPTCNIAFKKTILNEIGGFNLRYNEGLEDWDLALRLKKRGSIVFANNMIVYHQKKPRQIKFSLDRFSRIRNSVYLVKDHYGNKNLPCSYVFFRIVLPIKFLIMIYPPLLLIYYIYARKFNLFKDINYIFLDYFNCVIGRIIIWRTAFREKFLAI